jgi:hypothetical protein|nr:MAG TPA_asm: hypothetical protein [Caudoviricetes sp.]
MKFIPREELAFIVDHLDEEDVFYYTMKRIFDIYGDDWFVEGCTWLKVRENEERKKELERLGYKDVKKIQN